MNKPETDFNMHALTERCLPWLERHYAAEVQEVASLGFFSFREDLDEFETLAEGIGVSLDFKFTEWLLADGWVHIGGEVVYIADLLRSHRGPTLSAAQREMLQALRGSRLALYEVTSRSPAIGVLRLHDLRLPKKKQNQITVCDRQASLTAVDGLILGARVVPWHGENILSGAIYEFTDEVAKLTLKAIRKTEKTLADRTLDQVGVLHGLTIINSWAYQSLHQIEEARDHVPEIRDHSTGDLLVFTTDLYAFTDRAALDALMASSDLIHAEENDSWVWLAPPWKDGLSRPRGHLTITGTGKLKVVSNTTQNGDRIRKELEKGLGTLVHFRARQIQDPTSEAILRQPGGKGDSASGKRPSGISPELKESPELAAAMQQHIESLYGDWADEPLPAFENRTPRQMLAIRGGEKRVRRMIQTYESGAARQTIDEGLPALSYAFLYENLGLKP